MLVSSARPLSKSSPYLFSLRNSLTFRIRIPADIQACLGKTEYRRSIGRCYAAEAKHRAFRLAAAAFEIFSFTREALKNRLIGIGTTMEGTCQILQSTPYHLNQEETLVNHHNAASEQGYTSTLAGRTLSSLTDEEIRSIAETWLSAALKGADLFALQTAHIRNEHQPDKADLDYRATADDSLPVRGIAAEHLRTFKKTLFAFPANKTKGQNQDKELASIIADAKAGTTPEANRMQTLTVSNYCQTAIAFLKPLPENLFRPG